ncbi:MAG: cysteine peptidase family C39 domain-containing protein [candidate division KSB1 bacterium]
MVLEYFGVHETEATLRRRCKTKPHGTHPINIVAAAESLGFESYVDTANLHQLIELLAQQIPPIVTIISEQEDDLISHALIVQRITTRFIDVVDPEVGTRRLTHAQFDKLWTAAGNWVIVIKK